jgi:hypothetical protein
MYLCMHMYVQRQRERIYYGNWHTQFFCLKVVESGTPTLDSELPGDLMVLTPRIQRPKYLEFYYPNTTDDECLSPRKGGIIYLSSAFRVSRRPQWIGQCLLTLGERRAYLFTLLTHVPVSCRNALNRHACDQLSWYHLAQSRWHLKLTITKIKDWVTTYCWKVFYRRWKRHAFHMPYIRNMSTWCGLKVLFHFDHRMLLFIYISIRRKENISLENVSSHHFLIPHIECSLWAGI